MTSTTNLRDGLYCLWTEDRVEAIRIDSGSIIDATVEETVAAREFARTTLAACETMDDMPTVATDEAAAVLSLAETQPDGWLAAELVAVCLVPEA